ncbi:F-box protein At3g07870 isoform X1 [Lactuca sativa]|uniref:F-box domain-containing protein n=1 Tax=Lactuca sativa TaxID=4236 RepID=A0A9R1WQY2_LACSA|nr:F-box protein At3g07870 isoform X1 [Lactuca sativa]KAJ0184509.1 hypothetical protein LSAT_V11C900497830 [Lactuca sativa]
MSLPDQSMGDLPVEVMVDILSRLPVKTIIHSKCVCKKWLDIISDSYFANLHLSRSPTNLVIHHNLGFDTNGYKKPGTLTWVDLEDELDHHDPRMTLDLNLSPIFQNSQILPAGSVNGLICLWQVCPKRHNIYICNPITREYMILPRQRNCIIVYCFGVGLLTHEYKLIRIFQRGMPPYSTSSSRMGLFEAEVYTLGTGQWRSLGCVPYWLSGSSGLFLNGHAHWILVDRDSPEKIYAFDFDKETFDLFPSPPSSEAMRGSLGVINGCLCQCESFNSKLTIWVMKEYGVKKSWHKEVVIERSISPGLPLWCVEPVYVIEGFKDGVILMGSFRGVLFVYCPQRKTIVDFVKFDRSFKFNAWVYRPSFHRLHNFENERVDVF